MFPGRLDSLPHDLLDVLRTADAENDILDFPNLEWLLEEGAEAGQDYSPLGLQAPGLPILNYQTSHSGNLDQFHQSGGSGSGPLLHEHGPQGSSGGETGDMYGVANTSIATAAAAVAAAQQQATQQMLGASGSFARLSESHDGGEEEAYDNSARHGPPKKKRTRNAEQMQQNRVAQQKYRERKKNEQHQLQSALDQLTAQLAMMKAMEAKAIELKSYNAELATTVAEQADRINKLAIKIDIQAVELSAAKQEAATATALAASQQRMILDQHNKLQLQEEVIEQLRGRLFEKMEHAFEGRDPKTVCQRMVAAVRAALEGAKNVEGLQESLAQLPEPIITDICKSILCEVKSMWPELASRLHMLTDGHTGCHQQEMRVNTVGATF